MRMWSSSARLGPAKLAPRARKSTTRSCISQAPLDLSCLPSRSARPKGSPPRCATRARKTVGEADIDGLDGVLRTGKKDREMMSMDQQQQASSRMTPQEALGLA